MFEFGKFMFGDRFHHMIYFNLMGEYNPETIKWDIMRFKSKPYVFKKYYRRLKKLRRWPVLVNGEDINTQKLNLLVGILNEEYRAKKGLKNIKFYRRQISAKYDYYFSYLSKKYGCMCAKCASLDNLQIDHIKALTRGGDNRLTNLQLLCKSCNCKKSNKDI